MECTLFKLPAAGREDYDGRLGNREHGSFIHVDLIRFARLNGSCREVKPSIRADLRNIAMHTRGHGNMMETILVRASKTMGCTGASYNGKRKNRIERRTTPSGSDWRKKEGRIQTVSEYLGEDSFHLVGCMV